MDLARLQPFGIPCWVYQKKPIRDSGKSDKKERAAKGRLVGYNDTRNPCERAGWCSFRGKGPDETKERDSRMIEETSA